MSLFNFSDSDIHGHIVHEMKVFKNIVEPINNIIETLTNKGNYIIIDSLDNINLKELKENEGKNYHWSVIKYDKLNFVIRRYGQHLTMYIKEDFPKDKWMYHHGGIVALTIHADSSLIDDDNRDKWSDKYWNEPFYDLERILGGIIKMYNEDTLHGVWNNLMLPRADYISVKLAFQGTHIYSLDLMVFCLEEIASTHMEFFAENQMLDKLKTISDRIGEPFKNNDIITKIKTKVVDDYYHGVGIQIKTSKGETKFHDVYSLTSWYYDNIFNN